MTQQTLIAVWTGFLQTVNPLLANHEQALLTGCLQDKLSGSFLATKSYECLSPLASGYFLFILAEGVIIPYRLHVDEV
jgi:hypothetical protein